MKKTGRYLAWTLSLLAVFGLMWMYMGRSHEKEKIADNEEETVLRINFSWGDLPSWDPHDLPLSGRGRSTGKWIYEGLTRQSPNGGYELTGAEKVEISPCQKQYVFKLRPMRYSDGSDVTAYDFEASWKRALARDSKCAKANLFYCLKNGRKAKNGEASLDDVGVKAMDQKTLSVELEHPTPYFFNLLASCLFAPYKVKEGKILFNGPYMIDHWEPEVTLHLKANPFFWNRDQVGIKKIEISMIKDDNSPCYLYEKGELHWIGDPISPISDENLEMIKKDASTKEIIRPYWAYLNNDVFPLSSPSIRRALSYAIDRELIAEHIFSGYRPLLKALPEQVSFYEETVCFDPEKAKKIFEEEMEVLGLTLETFPTLTLSCASLVKDKKLAEYLKETWESIFGIKIRLDVQEWNTFFKNLQTGDYQIGGCLTSSEYEDPSGLLVRLSFPATNYSHWEHSGYQDVMRRITEESDAEARKNLIREAESILAQEMPVIGIVNQSLNYACRPDLKGVIFDYSGAVDLTRAYFSSSEKKEAKSLPSP